MPSRYRYKVNPGDPDRPKTVRGAYVFNLVDCIHACLLRGELDRARRAWAILVRCPDVNWRDRWNWGLHLLTVESGVGAQQASQGHGAAAERYLKSLQVSAEPADKPSILAELVLYLIDAGRYRAALEELDTYLPSYPYLLSGSLHTYAGLLCFYLAQPESKRGGSEPDFWEERDREMSVGSVSSGGTTADEPANPTLLRKAREWFSKAVNIDRNQKVAEQFINIIDNPDSEAASDDEPDMQRLSLEPQEEEQVKWAGSGFYDSKDDDDEEIEQYSIESYSVDGDSKDDESKDDEESLADLERRDVGAESDTTIGGSTATERLSSAELDDDSDIAEL